VLILVARCDDLFDKCSTKQRLLEPVFVPVHAYAFGATNKMYVEKTSQRSGFDRSPLICPKLVLAIDADIAEEDGIIQSGEERLHTDPYRELPILIFSHDPRNGASQ
jgi:hypothetical protein